MSKSHLAALFLGLFMVSASIANQILPKGVDPETGFRMERYRAPVPEALDHATTLSTAEAIKIHQLGKVIFVDVYPPKGLGPDPLSGAWVTNEKRENIPGSTWLPDVGRGHIEADAEAYFIRNLKKLSNNDPSTPLLFYCTADCWQSWNAAKRAIRYGFTDVYWYPDGTDGWLDEDQPLAPSEPVNFLE